MPVPADPWAVIPRTPAVGVAPGLPPRSAAPHAIFVFLPPSGVSRGRPAATMSSSEQCLARLGTSQTALVRDPALFLDRIAPRDEDKFRHVIASTTPDVSLDVTIYDEDNRPRREQISLGSFVEYVGPQARGNDVGIVVGCLALNKSGLLLVVPLDTDDDDVARLPAPDADCIVVETSRVVGRINVENKPVGERPSLLKEGFGFVLAAGTSFYGLDSLGTHPISSYKTAIVGLARARRGDIFAATADCRLVSFDPTHGKFKEVAALRLVSSVADDSAPPPLAVRGMCYAEGKPAQAESGKAVPGHSQMYCIGKEAAVSGDCICTLAPQSGKCQVVCELGRRDVVSLAVVPIRLSAAEPRNAWSLTGPSDADPNAMRFIVWTERGGLFVVDEKRRTLQQLGGDLVRSLRVTSVCFDAQGELYAAGKSSLYHISAAGRVTDVAPLEHLPALVDAVCAAPSTITNPEPASSSPRKSIFKGVVATRLRFFRQKPAAKQELAPRSSSFSGRRSSADGLPPVLPVEGTSRGELKRPSFADAPRPPGSGAMGVDDSRSLPRRGEDQWASSAASMPQQRRSGPMGNNNNYNSAPGPAPVQPGPYFPDDNIPRPPPGPPPPAPPTVPPPYTAARAPNFAPGAFPSARSGAAATVQSLLAGTGMDQYLPDFEREDLLDLELLREMAQDEAQFKDMLREMGIAKMGHREIIAKAVREI